MPHFGKSKGNGATACAKPLQKRTENASGRTMKIMKKYRKSGKKTTEKQRTQTKQAADTEIHRFFSILGSPGGGKIDEFSKKSLLKCMRFFACEKKRKKSRKKSKLCAPRRRRRCQWGDLGGCKTLCKSLHTTEFMQRIICGRILCRVLACV